MLGAGAFGNFAISIIAFAWVPFIISVAAVKVATTNLSRERRKLVCLAWAALAINGVLGLASLFIWHAPR